MKLKENSTYLARHLVLAYVRGYIQIFWLSK